jgi:HK97 family phage major capsid protein
MIENKEQLEEILSSKLNEMTEEMLKKTADVKKVEHLEKQVTELETYKKNYEAMEKSQKEMGNTLEALEKKYSSKENGLNGENSDLKEYEKSFLNYLRSGEEIDNEVAKKGMEAIYGTKDHGLEFGGNNGFILNNKEKKTLQVGVQNEGGYWVRPQLSNTPTTRIFESTPMRQLANVISIGTDSLDIMLDDDEFTSGGWVDEVGTRSVTANGRIGMLNIPTHEQYAQPQITQKLLDDAVFDIGGWINRKTNDILSRTENTAFVTGNGSKRPTGLTSYAAWTTAGTYERDKLEHVNSGTNGVITADGLIETQDALLAEHQNRAVWMMNRTAFTKVKQLKDGSGQYLLNTEGLREGFAPRLLGKPVIFSSDLTTESSFTTGTLAVAYGDFMEGYQIVDRLGIRVLRDPYTSKPYILFYTTKRVGGAVKNFQAIKFNKLSA